MEAINSKYHTAIHEAGHAVIGRVLTIPCGLVTIVHEYKSAGHSITPDPDAILETWYNSGIFYRKEIVAYRSRIITVMAGRIAEEECLGCCHGGDGDDRDQIDYMLDSSLPQSADVPQCAGRLEKMARRLVRRNRSIIEHIASLLMEKKTLQPEEVNQEIEQFLRISRSSRARCA